MTPDPYTDARAAAAAGKPRTANPYPKPDRLPGGQDYPGPWRVWDLAWHNFTTTREHARRADCQPVVSCNRQTNGT